VTEIDEGCVCCSLIGNLKRTIYGILGSFSPDTIILETSGLANPKNLFDELEELAEWVRFDATVTVVDALNFNASLEGYRGGRAHLQQERSGRRKAITGVPPSIAPTQPACSDGGELSRGCEPGHDLRRG